MLVSLSNRLLIEVCTALLRGAIRASVADRGSLCFEAQLFILAMI
jgi:hypothetical protein